MDTDIFAVARPLCTAWTKYALAAAFALSLAACATPPVDDDPQSGDGRPGVVGKEQREALRTGTVKPQKTSGAPYPAAPRIERDPNLGDRFEPVPTGPKIGSMQPLSKASRMIEIDPKGVPGAGDKRMQVKDRQTDMQAPVARDRRGQSLRYTFYSELDEAAGSTSACCPEISVAENGRTVMMTGNTWMGLSTDGGANFNVINPTTIFPQDDGGLCCDQVVQYVPRYDMFVWLMQYWQSGDDNRIRIAVQTTANVVASGGTAWTYWDFVSDVFHPTGTLDYNDMSFGNNNLYWTSQQADGRVVVRVPLNQLAAMGTVNFGYTAGTDALWSHVTHNATDAVFWAGHASNSELRVFSMRDADGFYSWRNVTINSWPNGTNTNAAPDGTDWLTFESWKHYVYGNARQRGSVWFGWLASDGGGFPRPHVQLVRLNTSTFAFEEQVQVWNPDIAFLDPYLSTNSEEKLGMSIGFGGGPFYASHAVGVWGDFVVYYPRLSTRATSRWGDYSTARRSGSKGNEWVAGGYTNERDAMGNNIQLPHYIRFDH
ncbi:MAG: hypothetical protein HOP03_04005 [Lysobacter sp.]|nr:hypothetical protein [Lysobacter sp.]